MYNQPLSLEEEAADLRRENYNVTIIGGLLIARDIPYVTPSCTIERGVLAFPVELTSSGIMASGDHTAYFYANAPCNSSGNLLDIVASNTADFNIPNVGRAKLHLSRKKVYPAATSSGYVNAREKLETYIAVICSHASRIDVNATPKTGGIPPESISSKPFLYPDTASARVGIGHLNTVFQDQRIGIIGLGGTGSYILDLVAKTNVSEIHLFDDDRFRSHNAFRTPGVAGIDEVTASEFKVDRLKRIYSVFRTGIVAHTCAISRTDAEVLKNLTFVFLAIDSIPARHAIEELLMEVCIPFIDVGLCATIVQSPTTCLIATIRTTFWKSGTSPVFVSDTDTVPLPEDDYTSNIQIAELNALNATLAVIRWKKHLGYYQDLEVENMSIYNTNVQTLTCI